jgi:programmed cell death protein 5
LQDEALASAGFRRGGGGADDEEAAARRAENELARGAMLKSILTPEAKERRELTGRALAAAARGSDRGGTLLPSLPPVNRVAMVKPDNARAVEDHLIRLARGGKLADRVDESVLIKMLEDVSSLADEAKAGAGAVKKVTIQRRKTAGEDDDDDEDF